MPNALPCFVEDKNFDMEITTNIRQENMLGNYKQPSRVLNLGNPLISDGVMDATHYNRKVLESADARTARFEMSG